VNEQGFVVEAQTPILSTVAQQFPQSVVSLQGSVG